MVLQRLSVCAEICIHRLRSECATLVLTQRRVQPPGLLYLCGYRYGQGKVSAPRARDNLLAAEESSIEIAVPYYAACPRPFSRPCSSARFHQFRELSGLRMQNYRCSRRTTYYNRFVLHAR